MFVIHYEKKKLIFFNSACITFWYKHSKVGIECPKNNVGKLYSLEWLSWNNPRAFFLIPKAIVIDLDSSLIFLCNI